MELKAKKVATLIEGNLKKSKWMRNVALAFFVLLGAGGGGGFRTHHSDIQHCEHHFTFSTVAARQLSSHSDIDISNTR